MALSNWDTLAFDLNGPCSGRVTDAAGVTVEIYKNWLYLHDRHKHEVGDEDSPRRYRYVDDVVGQIEQGRLHYGQWTIHARRGPQEGVYVVAYSSRWYAAAGEAAQHVDKTILVGCGVYGYENAGAYAEQIAESGVDPNSVFTTWDSETGREDLGGYVDGEQVIIVKGKEPLKFVGVLPSSVEFLKTMVNELVTEMTVGDVLHWPEEALVAIPWDQALRTNQGDTFLIGSDAMATAPGDADAEPVILKFLREAPEDVT